jgi:hypothetical protein
MKKKRLKRVQELYRKYNNMPGKAVESFRQVM